jgi:hypothetical protein
MQRVARLAMVAAIAAAGLAAARAEPDYAKWAPLPETFPSTGGGGWMIGE